jgi:cellulose synthase/poly-beta-1,6-N-acetylglucosamine synthase-like glycosyltransferase
VPLDLVGSLLVAIVLTGALPQISTAYQYLLIAVHFRRNHYSQCQPWFPRTAILIAAWNEGAVIGTTVDRLMQLEYPPDALRVVVVDDASTDQTPEVLQAKAAQFPGQVVHLRRDRGGEGKAVALNHAIGQLLSDDWMQALLIADADPIFEPSALRLMTRHLADPRVGAVTAYIKEGSRPAGYLTRFIGYEYITGQAAARRSQNVLGALQCLAGGAQLHSRENLEAIGGRIDEGTLAEDTTTTLETQLLGHQVVFEPHATVWAEEPDAIAALWKQRLRWARGNVQITRRYRWMWFRPQPRCRLGGVTFGFLWFTLLLQPFFMIAGSASLFGLYFLDFDLSWRVFHSLWLINAMCYVFVTTLALLIDPQTGRRTWVEAILYAGLVNVIVIVAAVVTTPMHGLALALFSEAGLRLTSWWVRGAILFIYLWQAGSMAVAWLAKFAEPRPLGRVVSRVLVYLAGYGSLMCAVTLAAFVSEVRGAEARWDKTEKTGRVTVRT